MNIKTNTNIIKKLDQNVINRIAAGEVIERNVSVVKELVENSVDAGATNIVVSLIETGLKEITVSDNGCGMDANNAIMALEPHATSKINNANDLFNINTLGFRGEALPSIISVSHFKIKTSFDGVHGTSIVLKGGQLLSQAMISFPKGTEVTVKSLFFNTPARLQNLKNEATELSYVTDYLSKMALANPHIAFRLLNNQKIIFQTFGTNDCLEVISNIYGGDAAKSMIRLANNDGYFKIYGYTSKLDISRSNRNHINIVVNGRVIKNGNIQNAVLEAYKNLLPIGRYPLTILDIVVDPSLIDVNVHPAKLEVRFSNEDNLLSLITETIKSILSRTDLTVSLDDTKRTETNRQDKEYDNFTTRTVLEEPSTAFYDFTEKNDNKVENVVREKFEEQQYTFTKSDTFEEKDEIEKPKISKLYYIGQLFGTYLLAQNEEEFFLIDQHAANERINYENIIDKLQNRDVITYNLLIPLKLTFTTAESILINEKMNEINNLGISIEEFGGGTFTVRTVPTWLIKGKEKEFVEEIIFQIITNKKHEKYEFLDSLAKSLACKKSIKANDYIGKIEIAYLLENLENCKNPYTCPHGRPVIIKFSKYEIEKWFKRVM